VKTMTQDKAASFEIKAAAKNAVAGMSYQEAFDHAQRLADLSETRPLTPQEELEFLKAWFGPDTEFSD
jgi:hypothetical protein